MRALVCFTQVPETLVCSAVRFCSASHPCDRRLTPLWRHVNCLSCGNECRPSDRRTKAQAYRIGFANVANAHSSYSEVRHRAYQRQQSQSSCSGGHVRHAAGTDREVCGNSAREVCSSEWAREREPVTQLQLQLKLDCQLLRSIRQGSSVKADRPKPGDINGGQKQ